MRKMWKAGLSLALAASMGIGSIPLTANAIQSPKTVTKASTKQENKANS